MDSSLRFRGYAGEIVVGFLRFSTLLSIIGILMIVVPIGIVVGLITQGQGTIILAPIVFSIFGRFAIQASRGDFHCGLFGPKLKSGESFRFTLLLIATNLAWFIPWIICFWSFIKSSSGMIAGSMLLGVSSYTSPFVGVLFVVTLICGPSLAGLFATAIFSDEFEDLSEIAHWLLDRKDDLIAFYAAAIGGIILFTAVYSIPTVAIIGLIASSKPMLAVAAGMIAWIIPSAAAIILMGRLTGAFVAAEVSGGFSSDEGEKLVSSLLQSPLTSSLVVATKPSATESTTKKIGLSRAEVKKRIEAIYASSANDVSASVDQLNALIQEAPMVPDGHIELVKSYINTGDLTTAATKIQRAVELGLGNGLNADVVKMFQSTNLANWESVPWKDSVLRNLCLACERQNHFSAAWWCALKLLKVDPSQAVDIQKMCFEIAERAKESGAEEESLKLFKNFIELFPESKFIDFVNRAVHQIESKFRIIGRSA